jgi:hypothetical protein
MQQASAGVRQLAGTVCAISAIWQAQLHPPPSVARPVERVLVTKRSPPGPVAGLLQQAADAAPYLTEQEFCERYKVPTRTAMRWRKLGGGPAFVRLGPRHIRYRLADTEAWALARTYSDRRAEQQAQQAA